MVFFPNARLNVKGPMIDFNGSNWLNKCHALPTGLPITYCTPKYMRCITQSEGTSYYEETSGMGPHGMVGGKDNLFATPRHSYISCRWVVNGYCSASLLRLGCDICNLYEMVSQSKMRL